ncbi:hsp70-binding protein 1 [Peromyscus eremicus]|uniref:hsp70-binding protein 1 n=1 Tax=Peromyscus californicus insignis TaxID=564181 RepID=UPI0022A7215A|nr:hsp70-binding protein 1 [Peromyscus californicus insignis]XP_052567985.1 hsp70-binding protein 1 [Peromyscus californicus insignis]XP_052567986.1 hsp70-binding protein 1 [Peromyscus californicus insignis]XP_052567987.1 hsp70-binding protein 1 [Peromyscus californicus insignis]XP_052567988.1 hsp70-binding protein 1 [Peromyscus californicus insignis]XP_052567989.1 hsp70-binding protein 1 [Peromyscus californicus insignis]XP_052567990.1 hsp70-binding protein 1 [Peromyscus californicus insigni
MADKGSGGSRLPLALPPASQGCSSGGSGSSAGGSGNPRPPRNLQGLLQMAITAGSQEPDPPPEPMSEERRQWLQEAMSAAFRGQREEVEQMKSCLRVLSQPAPPTAGEAELATDQQEREGALELLADLCENMDNAADFCQLSGMHLLVGRYLEAGPAGLRWRAAQLIGTCSQNVAAIQEQVLGLGALRKLLRLLDRDSCDTVRVKALFAISCLVREQEAGLLQFLRLDGFSVLMRAMQQQVQKLKVKSAFLLQNLLVGHPEHKGTLCSMGMVQQLVALVRTEHSPFHEHVLGALCSLVTDFPQGVRECREPELGLEELLRHRCQLLQKHEEYQEELEFCEKLLQTCFSSPTDDSMDR